MFVFVVVVVVVVRVKFALQFPLLPQKQQLLSYVYITNWRSSPDQALYIHAVPIYNSVGPVLTCCLNQTEKHQRCRWKMFCFSPNIASVKGYKCCFSSIRLPSLCCGGQPLHGVLWGAGTGDSADQTQAVEEVCWWYFLYPQEGLNRETPSPSQRGQANHQVHGGAGRRRDTPFPWHTTQEKRGWQPGCLCLQEAHAYRPVSPLRVPSSDPREERSGEMSPW